MAVEKPAAAPTEPIWVGELDLGSPEDGPLGPAHADQRRRSRRARLLVRVGVDPVGMLTVDLIDGELDIGAARRDARSRFKESIEGLGAGDLHRLEAEELPPVSIVIGTRNRAEKLVECVTRSLKQDYPSPVEIIVVDNGAADSSTEDAVTRHFGTEDRVRYIKEPRPGLSRARNRGLREARYPITAFLSDDIRVEPVWLRAVARGFARDPDVWMVAGFCPPMYLDNRETQLFESSMSWGSRQGFEPVVYSFDLATDPVHPYRVANFANGSNMICRTEEFLALGGFDEALGPGTPARGGEDLDAPVRILAAGGKVAFEPAVIGWHADRYDDRPFGQHMYTYGLGLTAFLMKHLMDSQSRPALLRRIPAGFPMLLRTFSEPDTELIEEIPIPLRYHLWHHAGRIMGPLAYVRSRRASRAYADRS